MKRLIFLTLLFSTTAAFATDDSVLNDPLKISFGSSKINSYTSLSSDEIFERTTAVLKHFQVPEEASNQEALEVFQTATTIEDMQKILGILDADNQLSRYMSINADDMEVFRDRDGREVLDAKYTFSRDPISTYETQAIKNLAEARGNSPEEQLKGLRIVIDPGHMDSGDWLSRTGKFVKDHSGHQVSEAMINLQTSLVLKQELEKLGAIVLVTRKGQAPVSTLPLEDLNLQEFGRLSLRERSLEPWFLELLKTASSGATLYQAFEDHPRFKALFRESARDNYFILREDLDTRVSMMNEFKPDISLVIHYDASTNDVSSLSYSRVKTYVHGSLTSQEWATQEDRRHVLMHALDPLSWNASFGLAQSVVNSLSQNLNLKMDTHGGGSSVAVTNGVFSRNLFITRKMHGHAHTYIECLHYNDPKEFKAMIQKDFPMVIDGETTYYSRRLQQVAFAIRDGVVNFVKGNVFRD